MIKLKKTTVKRVLQETSLCVMLGIRQRASAESACFSEQMDMVDGPNAVFAFVKMKTAFLHTSASSLLVEGPAVCGCIRSQDQVAPCSSSHLARSRRHHARHPTRDSSVWSQQDLKVGNKHIFIGFLIDICTSCFNFGTTLTYSPSTKLPV